MLNGVDLSTYQRGVNYTLLAKEIAFAYVKATDASRQDARWVPFVDPMHAAHTSGLRQNGVPTGSYCFAHPTQDATDAADFFVANMWWDQLRPVLDYESLTSAGIIPANAGPHCMQMLDRISYKTGVRAIIYASTSYASAMVHQCPELALEDWWAAAYPGISSPPSYLPLIPGVPRERVVAWQWTGTGRVPGISGDADRDVAPALEPMLVVVPELDAGGGVVPSQ